MNCIASACNAAPRRKWLQSGRVTQGQETDTPAVSPVKSAAHAECLYGAKFLR